MTCSRLIGLKRVNALKEIKNELITESGILKMKSMTTPWIKKQDDLTLKSQAALPVFSLLSESNEVIGEVKIWLRWKSSQPSSSRSVFFYFWPMLLPRTLATADPTFQHEEGLTHLETYLFYLLIIMAMDCITSVFIFFIVFFIYIC